MTHNAIKKPSGFTIVELLIVVVVIAILATISIAYYFAVTDNANDKGVQGDISKLSDAIKLSHLDNSVLPVGGSNSSGVGTASTLSGITFKPTASFYDTTVTNLYYCEGTLASTGVDEYAVVARSESGNAYAFLSTSGVSQFTPSIWSAADVGGAVCTSLGFSAPYTYSYGYSGGSSWSSWATP